MEASAEEKTKSKTSEEITMTQRSLRMFHLIEFCIVLSKVDKTPLNKFDTNVIILKKQLELTVFVGFINSTHSKLKQLSLALVAAKFKPPEMGINAYSPMGSVPSNTISYRPSLTFLHVNFT
jgi:hypothetical protein